MNEGIGNSQSAFGQTTNNSPYNQMQSKPPSYSYPSPKVYLVLIIIGLCILMIGGMIYVSQGFLKAPSYDDQDEYEEYQDAKRVIPATGHLLEYIGLLILTIGLIIGAIKDESLPANGRLGLLIAFGLIIGFKFMSLLAGNLIPT